MSARAAVCAGLLACPLERGAARCACVPRLQALVHGILWVRQLGSGADTPAHPPAPCVVRRGADAQGAMQCTQPATHQPPSSPALLPAPTRSQRSTDAQGVMQYMQQVQAAGLDSDDPLASYMLQVGAGRASQRAPDGLMHACRLATGAPLPRRAGQALSMARRQPA